MAKKKIFLTKESKLNILMDSESIDDLLLKDNRNAEKLLKYSDTDNFYLFRSPFGVKHLALQKVVQFEKKFDNNILHAIEINNHGIYFGYKQKDIDDISRKIYSKSTLSKPQRESVLLVFIQAVLFMHDVSNLLITNNNILLKNRLWFESHFPGMPLNIMTLDDALLFMDLFAKYRNTYHISGHFTCNKGLWYWASFRSKIPNYHVGDAFLDAFSQRFNFLLMSIDEIGMQYFSGINNDTMRNTLYHFNYFISLVSGVFDSLALKTKQQYKLEFKYDHIPSSISLNPQVGREFLKAVRGKNPKLRKHINQSVNLIKLIYQLRELIIHREMLKNTVYEYRGKDEKWKANFIKINNDISGLIKLCGDRKQNYTKFTKWGCHNAHKEDFLEPFHFVQEVTKVLANFCNKYLELLGFSDFIEELKSKDKNDDFARNIEVFRNDNIGF